MVTAEIAVAVPALVLVLALLLSAVRAGIDQVRCVDLARDVAVAVARGIPAARAVGGVAQSAPTGARVSVVSTAPEAIVVVRVPAPAMLRPLGVPAIEARSVVLAERAAGAVP